MDSYFILISVIGLAALGMAWVTPFTAKFGISYSIVYVAGGVILYSFVDALPIPNPLWQQDMTLRLTEMVVIVSLMGTGLKIDQKFSFQRWKVPLRLVTVTMILSIATMAMICWTFLGLDIASSLLVGAALAPTDPVLASDVQVGPPLEANTDNIRFSLTAEAGFNDGLAFPFTWLAILLALNGSVDWSQWVLYDVIYRIIAGVVIGFLFGRGLAFLVFGASKKAKTNAPRDGLVSLCATLLTYGATELIHGYGFVAVFIAAVSIRNYEMDHKYHKALHSFSDQVERLLVVIVLILFGGGLMHGLMDSFSWKMAVFAVIAIFVVRPLTAFASVQRTGLHIKEKLAISFYGIKGIGSFFYLAFAITHATFQGESELWTIISTVVLLSIVVHGTTASKTMRRLENQFTTTRKDNSTEQSSN